MVKLLETNSIVSPEADMRATVDSVISQLASLESAVCNTVADNSAKTVTLNTEEDDILQQALKNSGLPNKNEVAPKGATGLVDRYSLLSHSYQINYVYPSLMLHKCYSE